MKKPFVDIPCDIEYDIFETLIEDIINNCELNMFNTALVCSLVKNRVMDLVALYFGQNR